MAPLDDANPLAGVRRYERISSLSSGSFGLIILARDNLTGDFVAIKFIERGGHRHKYVEGEALNHRQLRHPHIIEFKRVFLTPDNIAIVMEYASGGSLFSYVQRAGRLVEPVARWFFQQLVLAIDYCHRKGVVNRDVKLENTLLQEVPGLPLPLLKICDFGYSKAHIKSDPKSRVGTLAYMAPEIASNRPGQRYDGRAADIWSAGVLLFTMITGKYPFEHKSTAVNGRLPLPGHAVLAGAHWDLPPGLQVSAECVDLLSGLLQPDPARRIPMAALTQHPWFLASLPPQESAGLEQTLEEIRIILAVAQAPATPAGGYAAAGNGFAVPLGPAASERFCGQAANRMANANGHRQFEMDEPLDPALLAELMNDPMLAAAAAGVMMGVEGDSLDLG